MGRIVLVTLVFVACVLGVWSVAMAQSGEAPSVYMDTATQVIRENNRIDTEIAEVKKNAFVTIRPYHVMERLKKVNKDAYAIWPNLFVKEVPDKYADLYSNLGKLIKLQMKRSCLLYDSYYYGWVDNRDKAAPYREELEKVECSYFTQKKVVDEAYANLQKDY